MTILVTCQIKSNHFYCHITTAQVPWWVKFLWACSRQCKKTTDNLPMDRQCKKTTNNLPMDRQCKKTALEHLQCSRQCKKKQQQFTYGQTVQKNNSNLHMDRQCKKTTAIYIWTVHIYMWNKVWIFLSLQTFSFLHTPLCDCCMALGLLNLPCFDLRSLVLSKTVRVIFFIKSC